MDKIPFSVYDFFAYLSSGSVILAALDYVWKTGFLAESRITPVSGVILVVSAYIFGQVVAQFSSFVLEQVLVGRVLKRPGTLLLGAAPTAQVFKFLFPNYHRSFPQSTRLRVMEQAKSRGVVAEGEALFLHAYAVATSNERVQARLDEFRNQYGFARNMSFGVIAASIMLGLAHLHGDSIQWRFVFLIFGVGIALFYRYLKFFRQYSYELFLRYAEIPLSQDQQKNATGGR